MIIEHMKVFECRRNCSDIVRNVLEIAMSWFHSYYATSCIDMDVCRVAVAYDSGVAGIGVFYTIPKLSIGVVYYIAVLPEYRGRGIGKALLASIEEILSYDDIEVFIATTRRENTASRRMLIDLGYIEVDLENIDRALEETITMMTCGYEDDLLYVKLSRIDLNRFFDIVSRASSIKIIEDIWRKICYNPWRRLRRP